MHDYLIAIIQGIVEGLTEFLPVSSTGHLILTGELLNFKGPKAESFEIIIQLGAILAVVVLYWRRILGILGWDKQKERTGQRLNIIHIILAMMPAMVLGLLLHHKIKELFTPSTVLVALVVGGLFMIFAEMKKNKITAEDIDDLSYKQAFGIGLFQCLALWPGFSRSGATIAGGMLIGAHRRAAADFSFIVAIPMMVAASGYDLLKSYQILSVSDIPFFAVGFVVSFIVAMLAIVGFLKLLETTKLTPFAVYRFILAAVFWLFLLK